MLDVCGSLDCSRDCSVGSPKGGFVSGNKQGKIEFLATTFFCSETCFTTVKMNQFNTSFGPAYFEFIYYL
jgi:hypothetical protein